MSKKQKVLSAQLAEDEKSKEDQISQGVVESDTKAGKAANDKKTADKKSDKNAKDKKKKKDPNKETLGKKAKATMSELKKVTWPSFGEVVKKTGVVIAFVLLFGIFLFGVNYLLGGLVNLLVNGTWTVVG